MSKASHNGETPAATQRVITACALMHEFDGVKKIFLARRAMTKKFLPGRYELPGGHIGFGEHIVTGLSRAILEELGVRIIVGDPFAAFSYINQARGAHSVKIVYFATLLSPPEHITLHPEDHSDYRWFSRDQLHLVAYPQGDPELVAIAQAFALLDGHALNFGLAS
jgi:8-oxo-dGTP diphosphatase